MRKWIARTLLALAACAPSISAQQVEVESFVLDNGMEFLLIPRTEEPHLVAAGWVAKVGSVNEHPGITGISHFFEHMIFKGTQTIGTRSPESDAEFISKIESVRTRLRQAHLTKQYDRWRLGEIDDPWDPANDTDEMKELRKELKSLQDQHRESIVKEEFDHIYSRNGGSALNAFTTNDLTLYFVQLPSNKLELWAWMESDRLHDSVFREFYLERDVVHEERRLSIESTPTGIYQEQFDALFWQSSPYSWPVLGWTTDLNGYTRAQAEHYFATYYCPNNLVGVLVGDFDPEVAKNLIQRYFSRLEKGANPPPVITLEMQQQAEKRMIAEGDFQPQITVRYHSVPFRHTDSYALDVLSELLNGRTGRLYKSLVEGKSIAASASAQQDSMKYGGMFSFTAECKKEASPDQLEAAWDEEVEGLKETLVEERELKKVQNGILAESYRRLRGNYYLLMQVGYYEGLGSWEYINESPTKLLAVTAEDIRKAARKYLTKSNRAIALYYRTESAEPADPDLLAIPEALRGQIREAIAQMDDLSAETLESMRGQLKRQADAAPEEMKPAIEVLIKKANERLAELQATEAEKENAGS